jgi:hypothetical protein
MQESGQFYPSARIPYTQSMRLGEPRGSLDVVATRKLFASARYQTPIIHPTTSKNNEEFVKCGGYQVMN